MKNIYFLTGLPKSGTTWLFKLLTSHNDVSGKHEGAFFFDNIDRSLYDSIYNGLVAHDGWFSKIAYRKNNWLNLDKHIYTLGIRNYISSSVAEKKLREIVDIAVRHITRNVMENNTDCINSSYIIDKTTVTQQKKLQRIFSVFPYTKVVYIERNAFDWIISMAFANHRFSKEICKERRFDGMTGVWDIFDRDAAIHVEKYLHENEDFPVTKDTAVKALKLWNAINEETKVFNKSFLKISYERLYDIETRFDVIRKIFDFLEIKISDSDIKSFMFSFDINTNKTYNNKTIINGVPGNNKKILSEEFINKIMRYK